MTAANGATARLAAKLERLLDKDRELLLTTLRTLLIRGISAFGTFALNLALARSMGAAGLGLFMLAYTWLLGLSMLSRYGLDVALLRFAGSAWGERDWPRLRGVAFQAFLITLVASLASSVALFLLAPMLALSVFGKPELEPLLRIVAVCITPYTIMYLNSTLLKAMRLPAMAPLFESGSVMMVLAAVIWGAHYFAAAISLVVISWYMVIVCIISMLLSWWLVLRRVRTMTTVSGSASRQEDLFKVATSFSIISMIAFGIQWGASLIIGIYADAESVGLFNAAQRTAFVVTFIMLVFNSVLPPRMATLYKSGDMAGLERLTVTSTIYMTLASIPVVLVFCLFPEWVLGFFGPEFVAAAPHLFILAIAQFINVCTGSVGFLLNMTGHEKIVRNLILAVGGLSLLLSFLLIPVLGIWGATISTAISLILQNVVAAWYVQRKLNIRSIPGWSMLVRKYGNGASNDMGSTK